MSDPITITITGSGWSNVLEVNEDIKWLKIIYNLIGKDKNKGVLVSIDRRLK